MVFALSGPNDGEPINARYLDLELQSNYAAYAVVAVHLNDVYQQSTPLPQGATRDPKTGLWVTRVRIDLERASSRLGKDLLAAGAAPVRVTAYLYDSVTSSLVTFDEWKGCVRRPWIELLGVKTDAGGLGGLVFPRGRSPALIHPLEEDSYLLLFVSTRKEILASSPDGPKIFREAKMVTGLNCSWLRSKIRQRDYVLLDNMLDGAGSQVYAVLWTLDSLQGWKRSEIIPVPRS